MEIRLEGALLHVLELLALPRGQEAVTLDGHATAAVERGGGLPSYARSE